MASNYFQFENSSELAKTMDASTNDSDPTVTPTFIPNMHMLTLDDQHSFNATVKSFIKMDLTREIGKKEALKAGKKSSDQAKEKTQAEKKQLDNVATELKGIYAQCEKWVEEMRETVSAVQKEEEELKVMVDDLKALFSGTNAESEELAAKRLEWEEEKRLLDEEEALDAKFQEELKQQQAHLDKLLEQIKESEELNKEVDLNKFLTDVNKLLEEELAVEEEEFKPVNKPAMEKKVIETIQIEDEEDLFKLPAPAQNLEISLVPEKKRVKRKTMSAAEYVRRIRNNIPIFDEKKSKIGKHIKQPKQPLEQPLAEALEQPLADSLSSIQKTLDAQIINLEKTFDSHQTKTLDAQIIDLEETFDSHPTKPTNVKKISKPEEEEDTFDIRNK